MSERLPTNEDADKYGRVQTFDGFYVDRARWYEIKGDYEFTHWMKMTEPPEVE